MKNSYLKKLLLSVGILLSVTITIQKLSAADEKSDTEVKVDTKTDSEAAPEETPTESAAAAPDDSINITFSSFEKLQKVMQKASENADALNKDFNDWITEITTTDTGTTDETTENK